MPGSLIKQKREQMGITQEEMAQRLHRSQSAYSRIENRQTALRADTAKEIAAVLNCRIDELLPDNVLIDNANELFNVNNTEHLEAIKRVIEKILDEKIRQLKQWLQEELGKR